MLPRALALKRSCWHSVAAMKPGGSAWPGWRAGARAAARQCTLLTNFRWAPRLLVISSQAVTPLACPCSTHPLVLFYAAETVSEAAASRMRGMDADSVARLQPFLCHVVVAKAGPLPHFVRSKLVDALLRVTEQSGSSGVSTLLQTALAMTADDACATTGLSILRAAVEVWSEGSGGTKLLSRQLTELRIVIRYRAISHRVTCLQLLWFSSDASCR